MLRLNVTAKQGSETNRTTNSIVNFIEFHVHIRKYFLQQINCKKSENNSVVWDTCHYYCE